MVKQILNSICKNVVILNKVVSKKDSNEFESSRRQDMAEVTGLFMHPVVTVFFEQYFFSFKKKNERNKINTKFSNS